MGIHKEKSPKPRPFHCHFTSVTVSFSALHRPCASLTSFVRQQDSTTAEILKHGEHSSKLILSQGVNSDPVMSVFTVQDDVVVKNLKGGGLL